jgi:hypothetical protein
MVCEFSSLRNHAGEQPSFRPSSSSASPTLPSSHVERDGCSSLVIDCTEELGSSNTVSFFSSHSNNFTLSPSPGSRVLFEAEHTAARHSHLQPSTQVQILFFITDLQLMARADSMAALRPAVGGSIQSQMEAKLASKNLKSPGLSSTCPVFPPHAPSILAPRTAKRLHSTHRPPSYLPIPPIPSATQAIPRRPSLNSAPTQSRQQCRASYLHQISPRGQPNAVHGPASVHSARSRIAITLPHKIFPSSIGGPVRASTSLASPAALISALPSPDGSASRQTTPAMSDSWASIVNTPLLPMFRKSSPANNSATSHGQIVGLAATKLNDLYGGGNVPRLDGPEKFPRSSTCTTTATAPLPLTMA